jgi:multidrug resistance efflux pump
LLAQPPIGEPPIVVERCQVRFLEEVEVPALESGQLVDIAVRENEAIEADQLIARLDDAPLEMRQRVAAIRRQVLRERLQDATDVELAETAYQEAKLLADTDERLHRTSPGTVSRNALQRSRLALRRAELERDRVARKRREAELELQQHEAERAHLENQLARLRINSPISGVVLQLLHAAGEWVAQGEAVARVARLDRLRVTALLHESQISPRVAVDTPVTIRWQEADITHTLRGAIASVDPQLHESGQFRVHVTIENRPLGAGWLLVPGRRVVMLVHPRSEGNPTAAADRRLGVPRGQRR